MSISLSKNIVHSLLIVHLIISESCGSNICTEQRDCVNCIQTAGCAWCESATFRASRCDQKDTLSQLGCPTDEIQSPLNEIKVTGQGTGSFNGEAQNVRMNPTSYFVRMRVGEKVNLTIEYNDEAKKPLDFYFLMDHSNTMGKLKEDVANSAIDLAATLKQSTSDLLMGFGSFVDKPVEPFQNREDESGRSIEFDRTYGYRHRLSLMRNETQFQQTVKNSKNSTNQDDPEGTLDALLQAVVCGSIIGWRNDSVRLLVLATDATFHIAGDARLAGIIEPHDGNCYLTFVPDKNYYEYTHTLRFDYPTVSLIKDKVTEHNIRVVFAVPQGERYVYRSLSALIEGSNVAFLQGGTTAIDIVSLVDKEFQKIIAKVQMSPPPESPFYQVKYFSKCDTEHDFVSTGECSRVAHVKPNFTFQAEIEVLKCPTKKEEWKQTIKISPIGVTQQVNIYLDIICSCNCTNKLDEHCKNGKVDCGLCECTENFCGSSCERTKNEYSGELCEICVHKPRNVEQDTKFQECIQCYTKILAQEGEKEKERSHEKCVKNCTSTKVILVNDVVDACDENECSEGNSTLQSTGCTYKFTYTCDNGNKDHTVVKLRLSATACPPNLLLIVLPTVGSILFVGLLTLLIWKLTTYIHDRREFQRFDKERAAANWTTSDNPLFVSTTTRFENPIHANS